MKHMHGNIPYLFDFWVDLFAHLLLKSFIHKYICPWSVASDCLDIRHLNSWSDFELNLVFVCSRSNRWLGKKNADTTRRQRTALFEWQQNMSQKWGEGCWSKKIATVEKRGIKKGQKSTKYNSNRKESRNQIERKTEIDLTEMKC